jgi:chemotaxis protein MotB
MGEISRQAAAIDDLNGQLSTTREEHRALGEAKDALHREMAEAEAALGPLQTALADETGAHGATKESLETLRGQHAALDELAQEQRASLAALETRAASLDLRIVALNHQKDDLEKNLQAKTSEAEVLLAERDLARSERDGLETKRATLQRRLDEEALRAADLRDQIEALRRRVDEADRARVAGEQSRDAAEHRRAAAAKKVEEQENRIRSLQTAAAERQAAQIAEIVTLGGQLEATRREYANLREERRVREADEAKKLEAEIGKARAAEAQWKAHHEKQAAEIAALAAAVEAARREHAGWQQTARDREAEAQIKLEAEVKRAREAEADLQVRHANQRSEIAGLVAFRAEAQAEKATTPSGLPAANAAATADPAIRQREETALLRQAIADLGSEVVRIAGSLKEPDTPGEGGAMPPDMLGVRERRHARVQS